MGWFVQGALNVIWSVLEPILIYGLAIIAIGSFVLGVLAMLPLIRFKAIVAFLIAVMCTGGTAYIYGMKVANREAELAALRLEVAKERADKEIALGARDAANEYARSQEAEVAVLKTEGEDYERQLAEARKKPSIDGQKDGGSEKDCDALDRFDLEHDPLRVRPR